MYPNSVLRDEAVNPIWQEDNGRLVISIDSVPLNGTHTKGSSFKGIWDEWVADTTVAGLKGTSGYRWGGPDLTWNPGSGILAYRFHIKSTGQYRLAIRSLQRQKGADTCFVRFDGGLWMITRAGEGTLWSWTTFRETSATTVEPLRVSLAAGFHQIEISGRKNNFCLERLALTLGDADAVDLDGPLSLRRPR